jgi:GT2 family glycosyltransferase
MNPSKSTRSAGRRTSPVSDLPEKTKGTASRVDCAVVIVTYNSADDINTLLDALPAAADGLALRTIVVDNGSTDSTVGLVRARSDVQCLEAGANLGYSGGINVGRQHAGDFSALLVLNPDVVLEPGSLRKMSIVLNDPAVGIVVPKLQSADGKLYLSLRREPSVTRAIADGLLGHLLPNRPGWLSEIVRDESSYSSRHAVDWAGGAVLLISADCDRAVGPWDEGFFLYSEDTDYAAGARAAGFRIEYLPSARAQHRGGGSGHSNKLTALMAVSRVRYMEKRGKHPRAYRLAVAMCSVLRLSDPGHRAALKAVLSRSKWEKLAVSLQRPGPMSRTMSRTEPLEEA